MARLKILLCGDSFAADWQIKNPNIYGWPNMLADHADLTNLARAGCSEYRILKQLKSVSLDEFDKIIVSHTSPYRIYVKQHPAYLGNTFYQDCDFLYSDCIAHELYDVKNWFENYFDLDYAIDIHQMIMREIDRQAKDIIHLGHMEIVAPSDFEFINFLDIWNRFPGAVNHYTEKGNKKVYDKLWSYIN